MIKKFARAVLPRRIRKRIKLALMTNDVPIDLLTFPPWSSPNVWEHVASTYRGREAPSIFEYGSGASTIQHIRNLLGQGGGSYGCVESDKSWYGKVLASIVDLCVHKGLKFSAATGGIDYPEENVEVLIRQNGGRDCQIQLKYRPPENGYLQGDGSIAHFRNYIEAIGKESHDLVVVDGRARKCCVDYVLDNDLISPNGVLALFEAGRGVANWLGRPTCRGDEDYQPVVRRMRDLGATCLDGIGYFSWPNMNEQFMAGRKNPPIPLEACILAFPPVEKKGIFIPKNRSELLQALDR